MCVKASLRVVCVQNLLERFDVIVQITRIDRRILHKRNRFGIAGLGEGQPQCGAAQAPDTTLLSGVCRSVHVVAESRFAQRGLHAIQSLSQPVSHLSRHLDNQNRPRITHNKIPQRLVLDLATRRVQNAFVHEFEGRRLVFENVRCRRHRLQNGVKLHHCHLARLG